MAMGEVVPQGKVRVIQHLEGGIVENIYVKEGDRVKVGTSLVRLNLATSGVNRTELVVRLDAQKLIKARLEAVAKGTPLVFPEDVAQRRSNLLRAQKEAFEARNRELEAKMRFLQNQMNQKELEVKELESRRLAVGNNLKLAMERFKMSESLLTSGLTPRMEHLQLEAEVEGHTDDDPIHTARYPSNWELSAGRATGVVRLFIEQGMDTARLKASGFAETRPKVPNRDASGAPVRENQAINRRVLIRVYPMSLDERKERLERIEIEQLISEEKESPDAQTEGGTTDQRTQ